MQLSPESTPKRGPRRRVAAWAATARWRGGLWASSAPAGAVDSAVVLLYHRFGEPERPSTNIRLDQFAAHLEELTSGPYTVAKLPGVIEAFESGVELPDRTVVITIDDAFRSVYDEAWPRLRDAGLPFTLFVATDAVDRGSETYMTWSQIRELVDSGLVTVGSQTASHASMPPRRAEDNRAEIMRSNAAFRRELGSAPKLFAYPFGYYSLSAQAVVREAGFDAAFAQTSGVAHGRADRLALPRFALNEQYGGLDRFRLVANALSLPVSEIVPADPVVLDPNPPFYGFTVDQALSEQLDRLACFASGQGKVQVERLAGRRVEVRLTAPLTQRRARVNCTMPGPDGRWRWFGRQFYVPGP